MNQESVSERRDRFRALHETGLFIMPNAFDAGSARLLAAAGFPALATTSSGHAATLGKADQTVTLDELLAHVSAIVAATDLPVSVDAERCFADDPGGVAETVERLAEAGAAGCSIEDYAPKTGAIDPPDVAAERVAAATRAAGRHGLVLTARAENHLYGLEDLDDTIMRLTAYADAGADVVYAPGLVDGTQIRRVTEQVRAPVNVLIMRHTPPITALAELGVRRVSTGGGLARAAYGALVAAARELQTTGTASFLDAAISGSELERALRIPEWKHPE